MKPILYNTDMVRAILEGRKTVTRRINKDGSEFSVPDMSLFDPLTRTYGIVNYSDRQHEQSCSLVQAPVPICPGDILWVRETWARISSRENPGGRYVYKSSDNYPFGEDGYIVKFRWHPSIHMPKEAARIFLRVTDVRMERLQDISETGARAEGCSMLTVTGDGAWDYPTISAITRFRHVWNETIKKADLPRYGWAANPWVWVIGFERISKEEAERDG